MKSIGLVKPIHDLKFRSLLGVTGFDSIDQAIPRKEQQFLTGDTFVPQFKQAA